MGVMGKEAPASQAPQIHVILLLSLQIDSKKELPNNDDDDNITLVGKILTSVKIQGSSPWAPVFPSGRSWSASDQLVSHHYGV